MKLQSVGWTIVIVWLVAVSVGCRHRYFTVPTTSMEPTIKRGQRIRMIRLDGHQAAHAQVGEIVVYRSPRNPSDLLVKRVAAVGGDVVEYRDKVLYRNGSTPSEPYVIHGDPVTYTLSGPASPVERDQMAKRPVLAGYVFLLGDNRDNSVDSRMLGDVPVTSILGRVELEQ